MLPDGPSGERTVAGAGFILPAVFSNLPLDRHLVNMNCNATAAVCITHHFLNRLVDMDANAEGKRGLIAFTSSSAGFLPTPISALYGATKTFLTSAFPSFLFYANCRILNCYSTRIVSAAEKILAKQLCRFCQCDCDGNGSGWH
jgi:hypothetical protein